MDVLPVTDAQGKRDIAAPAGQKSPGMSEQAREMFAAILRQRMNFNVGSTAQLVSPNKELAKHFDRPKAVEARQPQEAGHAEPRRRTDESDKARTAERSGSNHDAGKEPREAKVEDGQKAATTDADASSEARKAKPGEGQDAPETAKTAERPTNEADQAAEGGDVILAVDQPVAVQTVAIATGLAGIAQAATVAAPGTETVSGGADGDTLGSSKGQGEADVELDLTMAGSDAAGQDGQSADAAQKGSQTNAERSTVRDQAEALAKLVGNDNRISLKVETTSDGSGNGAQNTAALAPKAALAGEFAKAIDQQAGNPGDQSGAWQDGGRQGLPTNANTPNAAAASNAAAQATPGQAGTPQAMAAQIALAAQNQNQAAEAIAARAAAAAAEAGPASAPQQQTTPQVGAAQAPGQPGQANQAKEAQQPPPARPVVVPQQVVDQVKVNITRAIREGASNINIQLKPEHLGRIEVKLELSRNGEVQATVTADRPETLEILRQDARGLEKALQDAGLRADSGSLNFGLRGEQQQMAREQNGNGHNGANRGDSGRGEADDLSGRSENAAAAERRAAMRGGIDVRI